MRVIMVTNNALADKMGGHERYVAALASALASRGAEVRILAKRWREDSPAREVGADGVVVERYPVPSKGNPLYAALYPWFVAAGVIARARDRASVVHAHMCLPALPLTLARRRYLLTFHAPVWRELLRERQESYRLPSWAQSTAVETLKGVERVVARGASETVVLSEFMRRELEQLDPRAGERATIIPGGVDHLRFTAGAPGWHGGQDEPVLFTARRLTPRTGVDELIAALRIVRTALPRVRLAIAGTGRMEDELRKLAGALGLAHAVDFLGQISDEELVKRYQTATLVVMPTRELEGFGLSTAEALACGAAVVGTPAGATPELLRPLDPTLVTDDGSAPAIARAILHLLARPDLLSGIRRRARARVVPAMTWDRLADRYLELYDALA